MLKTAMLSIYAYMMAILESGDHLENDIPIPYCTGSSYMIYQQIKILVHQQPFKAKRSINLGISHGGHLQNHFASAYNPGEMST